MPNILWWAAHALGYHRDIVTGDPVQNNGARGSQMEIDYNEAVSLGMITGARPFGGYGEKTTAGADSGVLWPNGTYAFPASSGVQMSLSSTSANDAAAGTGIRSVDIHYLDTNLAEQVETVTLNGLTPVLTVATNIRFIQCMHMVSFGSGKSAAGTISASNGGQVYSQIAPGDARCSSSVRMVPAGKILIVHAAFAGSVSGTAAASTIVRMAAPSFEGHDYIQDGVFMPIAAGAFQDSSSGIALPCPMSFTAGQAFGLTYETDKAATVVGSWFGRLENA